MKLRVVAWALVSAPVAVLVAIGTPSCSSSSKSPEGLAEGCSINSDCNDPLVCAFSLCHQQCAASRDCSQSERCIETNGVGVCELPAESSCAMGKTCTGGLVCGPDQQCRAPCTTSTVSTACAQEQVCSQGLCYDPGELGDASMGSDSGSSSGSDSGSGSGGDGSPDGPVVEAGPLGYVPSNLGTVTIADGGIPDVGADAGPPAIIGADGGIDWSNAVDVSITANCSASCLGSGITLTQSDPDHSPATLYVVKSLKIASGQILTLNGPNPVIIASLGDVDIQGAVNVNGFYAGLYPGAGGFPPFGSNSAAPQGPGAGGNGFSPTYPASAAGGGSYCGVGAKGTGTGLIAPGGSTYGNAQIVPLLAGSAGGYYSGTSYSAFSGGAVQISSATSIIVRTVGFINAGGAGAFGGGGSGGAILLEAPTVTVQGTLAANGGGGGVDNAFGAGATPSSTPAAGASNGGAGSAGPTTNGSVGTLGDAGVNFYGGGGGGAGYIRINVGGGGAILDAGTISPDLTTTCATQGTLTQ
jgi:hypothetical protein